MRILFLTLISVLSMHQLFAQASDEVIRWEFTIAKDVTKADQYTITATAQAEDPQWHFWTMNPGDPDGFLIPTSFELEESNDIYLSEKITYVGNVKEMKDEIFGNAQYFEGKITFTLYIKGKKGQLLNGHVSFQACNDNICLRPAQVPFQFDLP